MGIPGMVWYGEDIGSAIETVENIIAKIKTNKFDNDDIVEFHKALVEVEKYLNENKD